MKNTNKKNNNYDILAEVSKHPMFSVYSKDSDLRIRLAVEVYKSRESLGLSQSELAKKIHTTQRIISNIENAEVNIGIELLNRIREELKFDSYVVSKVFNYDMGPYPFNFIAENTAESRSKIVLDGLSKKDQLIEVLLVK